MGCVGNEISITFKFLASELVNLTQYPNAKPQIKTRSIPCFSSILQSCLFDRSLENRNKNQSPDSVPFRMNCLPFLFDFRLKVEFSSVSLLARQWTGQRILEDYLAPSVLTDFPEASWFASKVLWSANKTLACNIKSTYLDQIYQQDTDILQKRSAPPKRTHFVHLL